MSRQSRAFTFFLASRLSAPASFSAAAATWSRRRSSSVTLKRPAQRLVLQLSEHGSVGINELLKGRIGIGVGRGVGNSVS
jgi:hypothetical protein